MTPISRILGTRHASLSEYRNNFCIEADYSNLIPLRIKLRGTSKLTIKYIVFGNESRRVELADGRPTARCGGIHFRG